MPTVVIAYDGSEDARRSVEVAASLIGGRAVILHVWSATPPVVAGDFPASMSLTAIEFAAAERAAEEVAQATLQDGLAVARTCGYDATGELRTGSGHGDVWRHLIALGDELDADALVIGRHEASALKTVLLGSVTDGVTHHSHRPVLIVPAPDQR